MKTDKVVNQSKIRKIFIHNICNIVRRLKQFLCKQLLVVRVLIPPPDEDPLSPPPGEVALHVINPVNQPQLLSPLRRPEPSGENVLLALQPRASAGPHQVYEDLVVVSQGLLDDPQIIRLHGHRGVGGGLVGAGAEETLIFSGPGPLTFLALSELMLPDVDPGPTVEDSDTFNQSSALTADRVTGGIRLSS